MKTQPQRLRPGGGYRRIRSFQTASDPTDRSDKSLPDCPFCGRPLVVRTARQGERAGSQSLGCSGFPDCRGILPLGESDRSDR